MSRSRGVTSAALAVATGLFVCTTGFAEEIDLSEKRFNVVATAQQELCMLQVDDFNISKHSGGDSLNSNGRAAVNLFTRDQATRFWSPVNGNYFKYYTRYVHPRDLTPEQAMDKLRQVIRDKLCLTEDIYQSLANSLKALKSSGVFGADEAACYIAIEAYPKIAQKTFTTWKLAKDKAVESLSGELHKRIGSPKISSASYDADKEHFTLHIQTSVFDDEIAVATLPVSIEKAPDLKQDIVTGDVWIISQFASHHLAPKGLLVRGGDSGDLYHASVDKLGPLNFAFTRRSLAAYEQQLAKKEQLRQANAERERVEREKRAAAAAERRRRERASWPEGAVATLDSGAFICLNMRSAMKAKVLERANNPYVMLPDDCLIVPEKKFIVEHRDVIGGLAVVRLYGATMNAYTDSGRVAF